MRYVDAIEYTGQNSSDVIRWTCRLAEVTDLGILRVQTPDGWATVEPGDFVVRYDPTLLTVSRGPEFLSAWEPDSMMPRGEHLALLRIAYAARDLRDSGYDGPFWGEEVSGLFKAILDWERGDSG